MTVNTPARESLIQEIKETIEKKSVELLHMQFVDIEGTLKHVTITAEQLEQAVDGKVMFDGSSITGFTPINQSDLYLNPDLSTFAVLPWTEEDGYSEARFLCSVTTPGGDDFEGDPRNVLKKTVKRAKDKGYSISVGPELEFFLFETDEFGQPTIRTQDVGGYFEPSPKDEGEKVRLAIYKALKMMGFTIEASHHEVAVGQHEINFKYADALASADAATTYKWVVKTVAKQFGLHATFMPKPLAGANGSGMHTNISLFDEEKQENAFYDETDTLGLSETAYQFIAGLIDNVKDFVAVTNPLVNSYKRLVPGYEAPCYIAWSASNRSALIRIPATRGAGTRVEIRCPDPSANPYLAFAVVAAAGLDGVERELTAPPSVDADIFNMSLDEIQARGIENLPTSLESAIDRFETGEIGLKTFGEHAFSEYVSLKRSEWDDFRIAVTGWEVDAYQSKF
ncbi:glutamine synthetase [Alkalihalobacillus alcalophilus ATCC 27647 = CGMCC 1.3604]|uniref:Glutamine synthetase n=1 Tax=Alkalihalobacillus alcalophilus ATCC 27647 = CGMCC 1.3604 TaxID=1218173 RepID=A0A094WJP9_ALKAL|nr:type I glutamate--ammonia ligase [Alkalihalobacillus alcalophilus]KGA96163.1 glutamine synthetase [Alkalihalobacillus alcalophilus ATCC 27647 = CGMCC 1.3604]MED1562035.1 type I glutamate--ammonia ligase [Alkalihalobacillus alcalophilus]THG89382.1 glutamine synthetase [Alkalihalobacillus alcalophilus ATCC 27647 = CGMCC 1.3604]